jgi:transmembrane 9 superfamily protein 2/4
MCRALCRVTLKAADVAAFKHVIKNQYHNNWIVDNLPSASILDSENFVTTEFVGFPVGYVEGGNTFIYNHVNIIIEYFAVDDDTSRIVGFYVEPISIKHKTNTEGALTTCPKDNHLSYDHKAEHARVTEGDMWFSYGVEWRPSDVSWASRWDIYLSMNNAVSDKVHWFSIVNSVLIVMFLAFMVAMILVRTLHRDINKYNRVMTDEEKAEEREETGWKLVHADVFRPPTDSPMLFCVLVSTGLQILVSMFFFIVFAAIGFLSPANRGSLMIGVLLIYVMLGFIAGYVSSRLYKTFKGKQWQRCTLVTATLFPGIVFGVFFVLDICVWLYGSTGAVPLLSMLAVLTLWFGVSVPLVFLGAYFGYKTEPVTFPVVTSNIPREVPQLPWYLQSTTACLLGGILPFGACFVEMFFIMSSIWMDQYYYVFGFLFLSYVILVITCAEITIVMVYFQLCAEDYNWWWRSFITSGSTAFYVFLYAAYYFARLESNMFITYLLYFGYMAVISAGVFLMTGAVGFFSALVFNYKIYGSIKVD